MNWRYGFAISVNYYSLLYACGILRDPNSDPEMVVDDVRLNTRMGMQKKQ